MRNSITTLLTGATGVGATEIVQSVEQLDPSNITTAGNLIIQIIIGICTVIGIFKRKK